MNFQHQQLAQGRWQTFSLAEQLGNIGSEVERAVGWQQKNSQEHFEKAMERALELFDLTLADKRWQGRRRELARAREVVCDALAGGNQYQSSVDNLSRYFFYFALAAQKKNKLC